MGTAIKNIFLFLDYFLCLHSKLKTEPRDWERGAERKTSEEREQGGGEKGRPWRK